MVSSDRGMARGTCDLTVVADAERVAFLAPALARSYTVRRQARIGCRVVLEGGPPVALRHRRHNLAPRAHADPSRHRRHRPDSVPPPQSSAGTCSVTFDVRQCVGQSSTPIHTSGHQIRQNRLRKITKIPSLFSGLRILHRRLWSFRQGRRQRPLPEQR